ncbi:MAG: transferase [Actinobacteria bacterium HGW-Actinobacteria-4]|nr:MAG: transferase [Actinobacteria bacterium HGW-Actinobacteria-4]
MIIRHRGFTPVISETAVVAPTAVVCGRVTIGDHARVLHGAVLTAEDGEVTIGANVVVMENAVIKGRDGHPAVIGSNVLIGPHAHLNGCVIEDDSFVATGASVFPSAVVGQGSEVRINAVVQVHTHLAPQTVVPIGWIAVGDPAQLHSPGEHEDFWQVQRELDFPGTVYGVTRDIDMSELMRRQVAFYGPHADDEVVG